MLACADCGGVKKFLMAQAQEHRDAGRTVTLEVGCINGGPITQVEQEEMATILADARDDAAKSGVLMSPSMSTMSYCHFLARFEPQPAP